MTKDNEKANPKIKSVLGVINLWIGVGFFMLSDGFPMMLRLSQGLLLMCVYPLVGFIQGKPMTQWIIQGTLPCPTTAYFLILIINASKRDGLLLYGLLIFWAIPFPLLVQIPMYGVYEDGIMFGIGLVGLGMLIKNLVDRQHKNSIVEEV